MYVLSSQVFHETSRQELVLNKLYCLDAGGKAPVIQKCHEMGNEQQWDFDSQVRVVMRRLF